MNLKRWRIIASGCNSKMMGGWTGVTLWATYWLIGWAGIHLNWNRKMSEEFETRIQFRCSDDMKRLLQKFADSRDISLSQAIRYILTNAIDILKIRGVVHDEIPPSLFL